MVRRNPRPDRLSGVLLVDESGRRVGLDPALCGRCGSRNVSTRRLTGLVIAGLLVLAVATRLALIRTAEIEVDEFQHLHSAWLTASGQKPYVDFFEHHPPLFYYLGAALIDPKTAD